jgi:hypothetical protein
MWFMVESTRSPLQLTDHWSCPPELRAWFVADRLRILVQTISIIHSKDICYLTCAMPPMINEAENSLAYHGSRLDREKT